MSREFDELLEDLERQILNNEPYGVFLAKDALKRHVRNLEADLELSESIADLIENAP